MLVFSFKAQCCSVATLPLSLSRRNINLIKQADPSQDGPRSSSGAGSTCSSLQLQLLTVARVHEAMAEGLAGGATQELGEAAAAQMHCCNASPASWLTARLVVLRAPLLMPPAVTNAAPTHAQQYCASCVWNNKQ
jgi:hypothetical protein